MTETLKTHLIEFGTTYAVWAWVVILLVEKV